LSFTFQYSHGGDRWNGPRAYLDYLGRSSGSADDRHKSNVFDGVNALGKPNAVVAEYYNPNKPLSENKWVRYGSSGVGEEYIEDASYLRLSQVSLSYDLLGQNNSGKIFKKITLSLSANNLFLITSYKGVDTSSVLFGYNTGQGLDLFNMPDIKSYHFSVKFEL